MTPGHPVDDRALIERLRGGEHAALGELYDRHCRAVYSLACRVLVDRADAEDVVQEVFAQAWRQASAYDATRATVAGWLLMMTRARAIDRLRARRARPVAADVAMPDLPDPEAGQEARAMQSQAASRVGAALRALPDAQRVPLELAYYQGLTQADIAARLSEPLGTVKTRMRSALQRLRASLEDARL